MFHLLIDTCVWLDLAREPAQQPLLAALEQLVRAKEVVLVVPQTVVDEFADNRERVIEETTRSLSGVIKRVKTAVEKYGDAKEKKRVLDHLNNLDHKLPHISDSATNSVKRVESLLTGVGAIPTTDDLLARAAQRAVDRRAPFHRGKNNINDAIMIETYAAHVRANAKARDRFAFVTHNTKDFSFPGGNEKLPHPDLADLFSRIKSLYVIQLSEILNRIAPDLLRDVEFEEGYHSEPRRLTEIIHALDELFDQVWYSRHLGLRYRVEHGQIAVVDGAYDYRDQSKIQRDVWEAALKAAKRVETRRGLRNLGPRDDFAWSMINGKLSALRWVLGDEWDMLDT